MCEIIEKNRKEAAEKARIEGALKAVLSLLKKGCITEAEAAEGAGMSISDFRKATVSLA